MTDRLNRLAPATLRQGPRPTGRDRMFDAIYSALGGTPDRRWYADKATTAADWLTLGMLTGAYDGGQALAETGQPAPLATALIPGARIAGKAGSALVGGANHAIKSRFAEGGVAPPALPQRSFADDYGRRVEGPPGSPIQTDIDGRPIVAPLVAGRRRVGEGDVGLTQDEIFDIAKQVASDVRQVPRHELPRKAVGAYNVKNSSIRIADDLTDRAGVNVLAHETGHAMDAMTKGVDIGVHPRGARQIYSELATGQIGQPPKKWVGPESFGYRSADAPSELTAEAIRAYLMDPNYIKTVSPKLAKELRRAVNTSPALRNIIHLNALAGGTVSVLPNLLGSGNEPPEAF